MPSKKASENTLTFLYIIIGITIAIVVNFGLGAVLSTSTPIVAVESNSMQPTFSRGDILIIQGAKPDELKQGDIIVFVTPEKGAPIVHRVLTRNADGTFQTKGDANSGQLTFERNIDPKQILGKEILIVPLLGWVKIFITETILPNWIIVVVVVVILVFIYSITKKRKYTLFNKGTKQIQTNQTRSVSIKFKKRYNQKKQFTKEEKDNQRKRLLKQKGLITKNKRRSK